MITCPICGGETKVKGSHGDCETTYRRRKCVNCGYKTYTEESENKEAERHYNKLHYERNIFYAKLALQRVAK